jgi:hypothetical protein
MLGEISRWIQTGEQRAGSVELYLSDAPRHTTALLDKVNQHFSHALK